MGDDRFDRITVEALLERGGEKWSVTPGVLSASVAEMDFPAAEPIRRVLMEAARTSRLGYQDAVHRIALRDLFADRVRARFGWIVEPARIELYANVMQGISAALYALVPEGRGVVVPTPVYPRLLDVVEKAGRRLIQHELARDASGRYAIDEDALHRSAGGASAIIVCNPQNPSGRVFLRDELEAIGRVALEHDLLIISDEIHADLVFPQSRHLPIASLSEELASRTITLTSATKGFNIPALRCAVGVIGSTKILASLRRLSGMLLAGPDPLAIQAAIAAWRDCGEWQHDVIAYLEENRRRVEAFAARCLSGAKYRSPEGTYLAWFDCRSLPLRTTAWDYFAERALVILGNGERFGRGGSGFVRLNFATSREILGQILGRLESAIRDLG